jgi:hypothetical protein
MDREDGARPAVVKALENKIAALQRDAGKVSEDTKRDIEEGMATGQTQAPLTPHTVNSLTAALSKAFPGMAKAIADGRVIILRDQNHFDSLGLQGQDTVGAQGRRVYNQGLYSPSTGKVYFVAGNISKEASPTDAMSVALHEIGEHAGLEAFLGAGKYDALLGQISQAMRGNLNNELGRAVKQARETALPNQKGDAREIVRFGLIAGLMHRAAQEEGVKIRWGADWNGNGQTLDHSFFDAPHFELVT